MKLQAEQLEIQKIARDFALREIAPYARDSDRNASLPEHLITKAFEQGLVHVRMPESCGGVALSLLDTCVIAEELAAGCSGIAGAFQASELALTPLMLLADRKKCLDLLSSLGKDAALLGLSAHIESDLSDGCLRAEQSSEGYRLQGSCPSVLNAGIAGRIFLVAPSPGEPPDAAPHAVQPKFVGIYLDTRSQGITIEPRRNSLGLRALHLASVKFENVLVDLKYAFPLGENPAEFFACVSFKNDAITASVCIGLARSALDYALRYALERHTFNQQIAHHQAVGFMLADMKTDVEAARAMAWRAAQANHVGQADDKLSNISRACRVYAQEIAANVATNAVQIFGGYGYSKEYPVEKLMRDAKTFDLFSASSQILKGSLGRSLIQTSLAEA